MKKNCSLSWARAIWNSNLRVSGIINHWPALKERKKKKKERKKEKKEEWQTEKKKEWQTEKKKERKLEMSLGGKLDEIDPKTTTMVF